MILKQDGSNRQLKSEMINYSFNCENGEKKNWKINKDKMQFEVTHCDNISLMNNEL